MQIVPGLDYIEEYKSLFLNGNMIKPRIRKFSELLKVLRYPDKLNQDNAAYYMFRDLPPLRDSWARFDVTVIPKWEIGGELAKTKGHYHNSPEGEPSYPEIYQVHKGKALYLLQRPGKSYSKIVDFIVVQAEPDDVVVIPPGYGHVTVNVGERSLVMSNIIYREVKSNYQPFEELRGAAYHYTTSGFLENERYSQVPKIRFERPWKKSKPIVLEFIRDGSSFSWLKYPRKACKMGFLGVTCGGEKQFI